MLWRRREREFSVKRFMRKAARLDSFEIKAYEELFCHLKAELMPVEPKKLGLRLLVIADTHGHLAYNKARLPSYLDRAGEFDLCVLLGDIHVAEMPLILDCIPREKIVALRGNHDSFSLYAEHGIRDVSGSAFEFGGVRFAAIDGSFRYKKERFPSYTQYESLKLAYQLPEADVLLTHDVMLSDFEREPAHAGLIGISYYVFNKRPVWHIHGHIHKPYASEYENGTKERSVCLCEIIEI